MTTLTNAPATTQDALLPDYFRFLHLPQCHCNVCGQNRGQCVCNADCQEFLQSDWEEYIYLSYRGLLGQVILEQKQTKSAYARMDRIIAELDADHAARQAQG